MRISPRAISIEGNAVFSPFVALGQAERHDDHFRKEIVWQ
jgi:hypothetical protein